METLAAIADAVALIYSGRIGIEGMVRNNPSGSNLSELSIGPTLPHTLRRNR